MSTPPSPVTTDTASPLVTCGSPIASLYAVFFPATFGAEFFATVRANATSWANFWRDTDPIATQLGEYHEVADDYLIPDPSPDGQLHGHSDYWIAPEQREYIQGVFREIELRDEWAEFFSGRSQTPTEVDAAFHAWLREAPAGGTSRQVRLRDDQQVAAVRQEMRAYLAELT